MFIFSISTYNLLTSVWYWSLRTSASDCPFFFLMCRPHSKTGLAWVYLPYITVRQGSQASKSGSCNSLSFSPPFLPFTSHPHNDTYGSYMVHIGHIYDTYMIHMGHDWVKCAQQASDVNNVYTLKYLVYIWKLLYILFTETGSVDLGDTLWGSFDILHVPFVNIWYTWKFHMCVMYNSNSTILLMVKMKYVICVLLYFH